jgi:hypothetical protein
VQDLPYGFRGIQNNLPALFGSIASAAGPAYFAFSALVALVTAYEKEIKALFITTTAAEKQQELLNNVVKESGSAYVDAQTQVLSLTEKVKLAKEGYIDKQSVINDYNDTIGKTIGEQKTLEGVNQALINQGPAYVDYMNKLAMAVAASKLVAQETENIIKTSTKSAGEFVDGWNAFFSAKFNFGGIVQSMIASSAELAKVGEKNKKTQLTTAEKTKQSYVKIMQDMYKAAGEAAKKAGVISAVDPNAKKAQKDLERANQDRLKAIQSANQAEVKAFTETLNERDKKEYEAGLKLAENLQKMREAGYTDATTYYTAYRAEMDKIATFYNDKELADAQKIADKLSSIQLDMRFKMQNALANINQNFAKQDVKNVKDSLNSTLKATKGNYNAQKDAINSAIEENKRFRDSAIEAGQSTEVFDNSIENLKAQLEGLVDPIEQLEIDFNKTLNNLATGALVELGTQLGNVFSGAGFSIEGILSLFGNSLIQIGTYLVTISNLFIAIKALFASGGLLAPFALPIGLAAIAAGVALKNIASNKSNPKAFANGGIISGPTMGLMGEYPGAASNPEVVAPLDKLQSLIGNTGGTLEARISGNDLLILMNKANRNNQNTF